ncbi:MAG: hypothetical protein RBG1_1C00001G0954 [candidate division Zixibacteria bacterium RBG-1]|nr:MAG: hypothetical protein RBG1_1C00001G0954 [candidate division Zixibacteria bacterium RBG-1]OGC83766.1 MAG: hypothetical protein A2V73_02340 [candidate division Zixibacteria bacterium RBG_19FT_COMBO_42_43]
MKKIIIFIILAVILLILLYIFLSKPANSLSDSQFVEIYVSLSILSQQYAGNPETFNQEKEKLFKQYKVTEKEFQRFHRKYQDQPEKWVDIWKKINRKLEEKLKEVQKPTP